MHRSRNFPARALTISGIAGLVIASAAFAAPAASAATQDSARAASPSVASAPAARSAANSACKGAVSKSLQVTPDLSSLHATGTYQKRTKKNPARVVLALTGQPSLNLNLTFNGKVDCTKDLPTMTIPITYTDLTLKLVPELVFTAKGVLQADFTWGENVNFGFTASGNKFTEGADSLTSTKQFAFTGQGSAGIRLNLEATIEAAGGILGVRGTVSPDINATVTAKSVSSCWTVNYAADANFSAFVNAVFFEKDFQSPTWYLGSKTFEHCTGPEDE